jgi:alanyl-tRNA synthetase
MMTANEIRKAFLDFFISKNHHIVPSAPMVVKNDPTLMFTNAGMNQFKDLFLGNSEIVYPRIADSQKCLRVSGKHNDLEEVGHDTYHHTMFEMLGNWSFGNYFKAEAIAWAWEFLTETLKIDKSTLYVTVFEGDAKEKLDFDQEAFDIWKKYIAEDRILRGNKKDNFWEMGDQGPCGPCSEIHVDIRSEEEKKKIPGHAMVNQSHPQVIEIWNNVFIQYNRKANGELEVLPAKHVDTGMGFERLCMVVQGKQSNYDTDVFQPIIQEIARLSGKKYAENEKADIAMRVIADHLRTISFAIADGQLPSNVKAGYVIRRILRRAVRYGYTFLEFNEPFIYRLLPVLIETMGHQYPELIAQKDLIQKVTFEEEASFLRTLDTGIKLLDKLIEKNKNDKQTTLLGKDAFVLYDTYGFPFDLTELILRENNMDVDSAAFSKELEAQKDRSRNATVTKTDDWVEVCAEEEKQSFIGYDFLETEVAITRYRKVSAKNQDLYQLVFNVTPFYAESGGQAGDSGYIEADGEKIAIIDTKKENNLSIHICKSLPKNLTAAFHAVVNTSKRVATANNHSATHLLHYALQQVLGSHVEQKGSLVNDEYLRFDFSHFQKMTAEEIQKVESIANTLIRENAKLNEHRNIPIEDARAMGAKALFGEKYGDNVRVICFGDSKELCGGTHVSATGNIGLVKITSEGAIAAGIRRIEAITADKALHFIDQKLQLIEDLSDTLKRPQDLKKAVEVLFEENASLQKQVEAFNKEKAKQLAADLSSKAIIIKGITFIGEILQVDAALLKDIAFGLKDMHENAIIVLGASSEGKANLAVMLSQNLVDAKTYNAGNIIREIAKEINGGGGGQAFFATAGGKNPEGLAKAIEKAKGLV